MYVRPAAQHRLPSLTEIVQSGNARVTRKGSPNYPVDFKRQLAALACEAGISVAKLALKHCINANLLFKWRRHYRAAGSAAHSMITASTN